MDEDVKTADEGSSPNFSEFYLSIITACNKMDESFAISAYHIVRENQDRVRDAFSGLYYCGFGRYLSPISDINDIFYGIVIKIFDENGDDRLDDENNDIRRHSVVVLFSLFKNISAIRDKKSAIDLAEFHKNAVIMGSAARNLRFYLSGLGIFLERAFPAMDIARQVTATRSEGGKGRARQMRDEASAWKREALPVALKFDRSHPTWTRGKIATEILHHFAWEKPGHRQIELWLKDEAEQPNGPLTSRRRSKGS